VIIPPVRLVEHGELVEDVFRLLLAQIRSKRETAGGFRAQIAANVPGGRRLQDVAERYGHETLRAAMAELLEYTERRAGGAVAAPPHRVYPADGQIDDDGS